LEGVSLQSKQIVPISYQKIKPQKLNVVMQKPITIKQGLRYDKQTATKLTGQKLYQIQEVKESPLQRGKISLYNISQLKTKQRKKIKEGVKPVTLQKVSQIQKLKVKQPQLSISKLGGVGVISPPPSITPPSITSLPFSFRLKRQKPLGIPRGRYPVYLRRFGKFRIVGYGRTPMQAVGLGKRIAGRTLGVTFKVGGLAKLPKNIYGFKTKKSKKTGELLFMEKPKYRLSRKGEKKEIQFYKGIKRKPVKKVKGGRKK